MIQKTIDPIKHVVTMLTLFVSLVLVVPSTCSIISFYFLLNDFVVEDVHLVCEQPLNNRCVKHYLLSNGPGALKDYTPGWVTFGEGGLWVGAHFSKQRYGFSYSINEVSRRWELLSDQVARVLIGGLGLAIWTLLGGVRYLKAYGHLLAAKFGWKSGA